MNDIAEHVRWLGEQRASGRRIDTDELWTLLYERLQRNRPLTDRVWRAYVTRPDGVGDNLIACELSPTCRHPRPAWR